MIFHLYLDFFIDHLLYYIFPIQISEKYSGDHPGDGGDQQNPTEWESECLAYGQTRGVGARDNYYYLKMPKVSRSRSPKKYQKVSG